MKPKALLLPLAVIMAAFFLLVSQSKTLSSIRAKTLALREQIAASHNQSSSAPDSMALRQEKARSGASINWLRIAELTGEQHDGIFARQELLHARRRVQLMSPAEL
ncbi:MAG: hypothetical protein EOP85_05120, partial [Verrucomicrobiaceae bacterium]